MYNPRNNIIKKIFILLVKTIFVTILILLFIVSLFYLNTTVYNYPEISKFKGDSFYNPYKNFKGVSIKANFHAHTESWGSITNGENSTNELYEGYKKMGYDFIGISNYFKITKYTPNPNDIFIPCYEQGYNIFKTHRLVIGSNNVSFFDYPLYQFTFHKQKIINNLKANNKVIVALAHPEFFSGLKYSDMDKLVNYDLIEVLNHYCVSQGHWDRALSAGRLAFLIADDDTHDIYNEPTFKIWNNLFMEKIDSLNIINALLSGQNYGVMSEVAGNSENALQYLNIQTDELNIKFKNRANIITLIGQNGEIKKQINDTNFINYKLNPDDTYIRAVVKNNNSTIYLNPVLRYDGKNLPLASKLQAHSSTILSILFIICIIIIELIILKLIQKSLRFNVQKNKISA